MAMRTVHLRRGIQIEIATVIWVVIEGAVAVGSGVIAHSISLVALGVDSFIELISALILLWRLSVEAKGEKVEKIVRAEKTSEWVVGCALLALTFYIVIAAIHELFTHTGAESSFIGLGLAIVSAILMPFLSSVKKRIGSQIGSHALVADSSATMVCAYMAWTVLLGVALTSLFGWWWADSAAALALALFVVKEAFEAIGEARESI